MTKTATLWIASPLAIVRSTRPAMIVPPCPEVGKGRARDPARGKSEERFLVLGEGPPGVAAPIAERTVGHGHAQAEAARTPLAESVEQRVAPQPGERVVGKHGSAFLRAYAARRPAD